LLSVCVSVYPPIVGRQRFVKNRLIVARQRLGKNPPIFARQRLGRNVTCGNEYTLNNRRIVGGVVFNVARVISRKVGD
jgi:hypothetical protein